MGAILLGNGSWNPPSGVPQAPFNTVAPSLSGLAQAGQTLTVSDGTWSGSVTSTERQMQRSDNGTSGWTDIAGATGTTYAVLTGDVGKYLRAAVRKIGPGGTGAWAYSAATSAVAAAAGGAPLLQEEHVTGTGRYVGSFKLPDSGLGNPTNFVGGGWAVAYCPALDGDAEGLVIEGRWPNGGYLTKVTIPTPVNTSVVASMPTAAFLTPSPYFFDISNGQLGQLVSDGDYRRSGGVLVYDGDVYQCFEHYYDSDQSGTLHTHVKRETTNLNSGAVTVPRSFAQATINGNTIAKRFYCGPMCPIPTAWQTALGGTALQGDKAYSISVNQSSGPFAASWRPEDFTNPGTVANTVLVGYHLSNPLQEQVLGQVMDKWNFASYISGILFPEGSRSVLFVGTSGSGPLGYGVPGETSGGVVIVDPVAPDKGYHAYPYRWHIWAYDAEELAAVKAGTMLPDALEPYATWDITTIPGDVDSRHPHDCCATHDPATDRLFLVETNGRSGSGPLVHVFQLEF